MICRSIGLKKRLKKANRARLLEVINAAISTKTDSEVSPLAGEVRKEISAVMSWAGWCSPTRVQALREASDKWYELAVRPTFFKFPSVDQIEIQIKEAVDQIETVHGRAFSDALRRWKALVILAAAIQTYREAFHVQ